MRDVAVFPLSRPDGSQEIAAALVLEPGGDLDAVRRGAAARLGDQAPTRLVTLESLPRTPTGKVVELSRKSPA